jgi:quinol monooxygenase YgiN
MYASITTVSIRADQAAEATRLWQEEILPITRTLPGWKGAELFTDPQTGEGVAVNFYATEADVNAVESSGAFQQLMGKLARLMTAPPARKVYQVAGEARL